MLFGYDSLFLFESLITAVNQYGCNYLPRLTVSQLVLANPAKNLAGTILNQST